MAALVAAEVVGAASFRGGARVGFFDLHPAHMDGIDRGNNIYETTGYAVHFFDRALIDQLAVGWELENFTADSEGTLPDRSGD